MANHQSAKKRIRSSEKRRLQNRYYARTMRSSLRTFRAITVKKEAEDMFPKLSSLVDKLAKKNVIHKNKASNLKAKMAKQIAGM